MPIRAALAWLAVGLWMAATFVTSHQSSVSIPFGAPDYFAHGLAYAVLGALLTHALAGGRIDRMTWRLALMATVIGALYGVTDEFHQWFVPGRFASVSDLIADAIGTAVGATAAAAVGSGARRTGLVQGPS